MRGRSFGAKLVLQWWELCLLDFPSSWRSHIKLFARAVTGARLISRWLVSIFVKRAACCVFVPLRCGYATATHFYASAIYVEESRSISCIRPSLTGGSNAIRSTEPARVHHAARRRSCRVAALGARATAEENLSRGAARQRPPDGC